MGERKEICQRQAGVSCNGCEVAIEVANNVVSQRSVPVVESILEVTNVSCPEGTSFLFHGDLGSLVDSGEKVIQLRRTNGKTSANQEGAGAAAAGL